MRTTKCKNQTQQLPDQVVAEISKKGSIEKLPDFPKTASVKARLFHLDGRTSEITMTLPFYTSWSEFLETGMNAVREYIYDLTKHWIKISHFIMVTGTINKDGSINSMFEPIRYDIPLGLFYQSSTRGKWVNAEQHPQHPRFNQRGSSIDLGELMRIIAERCEAVYNKIDDSTTQCGIPFESRGSYFRDGDIPSGEFLHNGKLHFVVYSFIKTIEEGGRQC